MYVQLIADHEEIKRFSLVCVCINCKRLDTRERIVKETVDNLLTCLRRAYENMLQPGKYFVGLY